jgi:hypothetical protein
MSIALLHFMLMSELEKKNPGRSAVRQAPGNIEQRVWLVSIRRIIQSIYKVLISPSLQEKAKTAHTREHQSTLSIGVINLNGFAVHCVNAVH